MDTHTTLTYTIISIHALREEGDRLCRLQASGRRRFLSTPSARRATLFQTSGGMMGFYFYPRPPRGGRRLPQRDHGGKHPISIHALREEGDAPIVRRREAFYIFLSTPSARRATGRRSAATGRPPDFYPRPPRGGRRCRWRWWPWPAYFYPRPPRGGRPLLRRDRVRHRYFYPRPPRGGRLGPNEAVAPPTKISIHALREEGDSASGFGVRGQSISIHALREEGDNHKMIYSSRKRDFYPRPPRGGRQGALPACGPHLQISIHALREEGDLIPATLP